MILHRAVPRRPRGRHPLSQVREYLRYADEKAAREAARGGEAGKWIARVATVANHADPDPAHGTRVGALSGRLAVALGWAPDAARELRDAAELHDIGKYALPQDLLQQRGPLSASQRDLLALHTCAACWLLGGLQLPVFELARVVGRGHHERWDGTGYPDRTFGTDTPLPARIVAAADIWDALTHPRPYRPAFSEEQAASMIREMSGTALDPHVTAALLQLAA